MPDLADLLERESRRADPAPGGFDRLARRRDRRTRNRRIGAGALALVVAVAAVAALLRAEGSSEAPASPSPTTGPSARTFPGLPPEGAKPTQLGQLELSYSGPAGNGNQVELSVYSDGRMVWQRWTSSHQPLVVPDQATAFGTAYVWQRLTPDGVDRLRSEILSTGLFTHDAVFAAIRANFSIDVRVGGHLVDVEMSDYASRRPTSAQVQALNTLRVKLADPAAWLSDSDWADTGIRAFVPACYWAAYERSSADLTQLPPALAAELGKHLRLQKHAYEVMTTDDARALLQALVAGGFEPVDESAEGIGFELPPSGVASYLHIHPALPDRGGC